MFIPRDASTGISMDPPMASPTEASYRTSTVAETLAQGAVPPDGLPAELLDVEAEILAADVTGGPFPWLPLWQGGWCHG